jgi:hypothetical protein
MLRSQRDVNSPEKDRTWEVTEEVEKPELKLLPSSGLNLLCDLE